MTQDLADQLTAETVKDTVRNRLTANYSYGYDANSNRTSDSAGPYTTNNVNQITNSGYTYDLNGNLLSDGTRTYEWDAANRLVAINQGRQRSEFTYESSGHFARIVEKDRGRITSDTRYVWNGVKLLEMRDTATNAVLARYYDQGAVVTPATNPLRLYATFDHLGSVREVTDASGNLQARYDYDPYGKPTQLAGRIQSNILYAGYFYHAPSGLYFTQNRAYDPSVGRWLSRDPIGEVGSINLYRYVHNSPLTRVDPLGLRDLLVGIVPRYFTDAQLAAYNRANPGNTQTQGSNLGENAENHADVQRNIAELLSGYPRAGNTYKINNDTVTIEEIASQSALLDASRKYDQIFAFVHGTSSGEQIYALGFDRLSTLPANCTPFGCNVTAGDQGGMNVLSDLEDALLEALGICH